MNRQTQKEFLNSMYGCYATLGGTVYDMNLRAGFTYMVGPHTSSDGTIYRRKVWRGREMLERKHICADSECWENVEGAYIDMTSNPPVVYEDEEDFKKFLKERGIIKP